MLDVNFREPPARSVCHTWCDSHQPPGSWRVCCKMLGSEKRLNGSVATHRWDQLLDQMGLNMSKQNGSNFFFQKKTRDTHTWVRRFQYLFIQFHPKCWMLLTHSQVLATVVVSIGVDQPWESMCIFTAMSGYGLDDMDDVIYDNRI